MGIKYILTNLLRREPTEVKTCIYEMNRIEQESNCMAFKEIKPALVSLIKDADKTVYSIKNNGLSPATLVNLLITNVISKTLPSGKYCTYRGVLSLQGNELLRLWDYCVNNLETYNYHSKEQANEDKRWIRHQIRECG